MSRLPYDWDCIQLGFESEEFIPFFLHPKLRHSYFGPVMMTRDYVEKIMEEELKNKIISKVEEKIRKDYDGKMAKNFISLGKINSDIKHFENEKEKSFDKIPIIEEEIRQININKPFIKKEMIQKESESIKKSIKDKVNISPNIEKTSNNFSNKNKRPNINRNFKIMNPININITHDNNIPRSINNVKNQNNNKNISNLVKIPDKNNYKSNDICKNNSIMPGIDNINQKYFPTYLENNKCYENNNKNHIDAMKQFLNEKNYSPPFILENQWAEWKPLD